MGVSLPVLTAMDMPRKTGAQWRLLANVLERGGRGAGGSRRKVREEPTGPRSQDGQGSPRAGEAVSQRAAAHGVCSRGSWLVQGLGRRSSSGGRQGRMAGGVGGSRSQEKV